MIELNLRPGHIYDSRRRPVNDCLVVDGLS